MDMIIDRPPQLSAENLDELYRYLCTMSDRLNELNNSTGGGGITDEEMTALAGVFGSRDTNSGLQQATAEYLSLKSLIIKTATWIKSEVDEMRTTLSGQYLAKSNLGEYSKDTKMTVVMDSEGVTRTFTLKEMLQGEKSFDIIAKGYIRQGRLNREGAVPEYGIEIGKDIVDFKEDGSVEYHDENKVCTMTADEIAFWTKIGSDAVKLASYTGSGVALYVNGNIAAVYSNSGLRLYQQNGTAGAYTMQVLSDSSFGIRYEPILG